jgi:hypothetical protein
VKADVRAGVGDGVDHYTCKEHSYPNKDINIKVHADFATLLSQNKDFVMRKLD